METYVTIVIRKARKNFISNVLNSGIQMARVGRTFKYISLNSKTTINPDILAGDPGCLRSA
jgi:hypothetical protein